MAGRHRAPAPHRGRSTAVVAVLTLAGTTSGGLTLGDIAAAAPTVPSVDWDRVAECESGQDWAINTGNGYSGGLQFSPSTWQEYGGGQFAARAHQATREQQIVVAERTLRGQGIGAWPTCGRRGVGGTTAGAPTAPSTAPRTTAPSRTSAPRSSAPAVPDQPAPVQEAVAASGPTNPACVSLKTRGIPVAQLDALDRAHPELMLDGNGNGVPCDVTYPRSAPRPSASGTSSPSSTSSAPRTTERTAAPSTATSPSPSSAVSASRGERIVAEARRWIGTRYRYGGESGPGGSGVDCSSMVQQVMRANGITVPRTSAQQARAVQRITREQLRPGDLVFGVTGGRVHHVGIYVGGGRQIDAPRAGKPVAERPLYSSQTLFGRVR